MATGRGVPIFGREAEMAALRDVASVVANGEPAGAVLLGEPGVGKTRLAEEIAEELRHDGAVVVTSHGVELAGGELPYAGVAELVRGLVRVVGAAELTRAAGRDLRPLGALDRALGDEAVPERTAVTAALLAAVEGVGRRRVLVWLVDDLQWLDAASRDLVGYLVRVVQDARLLLLATAREAPATDRSADPRADHGPDRVLDLARVPGVRSIQVRPLTAEAVDAQARALSTRPLGAGDLDRIRRQSDGLPFFVEELVAAEGLTPPTLRNAVTMNTRHLADDTRLLLRAAALEETLAHPELLGRVAGLGDADLVTALGEARAHDVVRLDRDADVVRFRHALLRDAVDEEMLGGERRALHRRWAEALDELHDDPAGPGALVVARARHWHETGDAHAAYPHVLAAAQYVDGVEDCPAQALWWGRLLSVWSGEAEGDLTRDRVLWNLLQALVGAGEVDEALASLDAEIAGTTPSDRLRALWLALSRRQLRAIAGADPEVGVPAVPGLPGDADELLAWLRGHGPDFRVGCSLHFLLHVWDTDRADLYLPTCDELARRSEAEDDIETWYLAARHRGWWLQSQGDFAGQLETAREARELVLARMPARRLEAEWDWCWGLEEAGRYAEACTAAEAALARVEEPRAVIRLWSIVACCAAAAHAALGRWAEADDWLTRIHQESSPNPDDATSSLLGRLNGTLAARRGELVAARRVLRDVPSHRDGAPGHLKFPLITLASELALLTGDRAGALDAIERLEGFPKAVGIPDEVTETPLSLARGIEPSDRGLLDRVLAQTERLLPVGGPVQTVARAELAEHRRRVDRVDSAAAWAEVADRWREFGRVYDVAWCRHLEAVAAAREGRRDDATAALAEAWRIAGALGAEPLRERVASVARRARLPLEGLRSQAVGALTERETEVLRLVARGRTNAQIADELVISSKTASVHVSRILAKLGATNRTEAAAAARRLGLE